MKKYKIISDYPRLPKGVNVGDIVEPLSDTSRFIVKKTETNTIFIIDKCEISKYPKFFEPVEDPLFITEDGFEIYGKDTYYVYYKRNSKSGGPYIANETIKYSQSNDFLRFKEKDAIDEHSDKYSKRYSKSDIQKALSKTEYIALGIIELLDSQNNSK